MTLKLAIADYTFPKLEWEQALRLIRDLGIGAVDIGVFAGRSHIRPEDALASPAESAARIANALQVHGLEIADILGQPGSAIEEQAVNHPDLNERKKAADFFWRLLELAARSNTKHMTLLPGVPFAQADEEDSLKRSAGELAWRTEAAAKLGIVLAVEAHVGSIVPTPSQALRLLALTPGLSLTLDYGHFTCQGIPDSAVEPLLPAASHFHARAASKGKLQAALHENTIDFGRVLRAMKKSGYSGYTALEYVWTEWMNCNEVDNLSETILLRDQLRAMMTETPTA